MAPMVSSPPDDPFFRPSCGSRAGVVALSLASMLRSPCAVHPSVPRVPGTAPWVLVRVSRGLNSLGGSPLPARGPGRSCPALQVEGTGCPPRPGSAPWLWPHTQTGTGVGAVGRYGPAGNLAAVSRQRSPPSAREPDWSTGTTGNRGRSALWGPGARQWGPGWARPPPPTLPCDPGGWWQSHWAALHVTCAVLGFTSSSVGTQAVVRNVESPPK